MAELAGIMVGNYFLLERLSCEGIVETYLARPTTYGGYDVYLRLFRPRCPDPLAFQDHFSTEVRKVWRCQHPHIQALTEFGEGDGVLYTATRADGSPTLEQVLTKPLQYPRMDRGDGENLKPPLKPVDGGDFTRKTPHKPGDFVPGHAQLPVSQVTKLIVQLCEALQHAHEHGIIHGNLQPSSILLVSSRQARLTNFGLRQAYQEGDPIYALVEEGNAAYVAPEQVVGMLCPASDIYALGILLYRLLSGVLPYDGESAGEMAMLHANAPIPSLRALRPDLPEAVEMVVRVALAKKPTERFPTPHSLAAALIQALVKNKPPADVVTRRIAVNPRRTRLTWSRALSLMALVLILLALSSTLYLFSFSALPFSTIPGFPLRASNGPGSFPVFFPALRSANSPTPTPSSSAAATQPTAGHQPFATSTPGGQDDPTLTPVATPTLVATPTSGPGIQLSPIIFPASPAASSTPSPLACVPGSLSINGSFYMAPLFQQVGADYQTFCPGLTLHLGDQGCVAGLEALEHGQIDLAASDLSTRAARKLTDYPLAALLYAIVVSPDVQISGLSSQQLQAIYQGQVTNWSQLGGPDEAISVLLHPSSDPLNVIYQTFVLNGTATHVQGLKLSKKLMPEQVVQKVAQTPGAITFVSLAVTSAVNVHVLALNRVQPTLQNVLQGSYPFWSVEHLYASATATAQAQAYMQFFQSAPETNRLAQFGALPSGLLAPAVLASHVPGPYVNV